MGKWILNFVICEAFENSMSETKKKRPLHHRIAYSYFLKLQADKPFPEDAHHILNEQELAWMARVRRTAMLTAGAYGAFFVLVYYIPIYIWPEWWKTLVLPWELPLLGKFNWGKQVWSIILVLMELFFLTRLNIWSVADTANACGFPDRRDPNYDHHVEQLFTVGLESKNKETLQFGIDPYEDTPRFYLFIFTLWNLFRATLASFLLRFVFVKAFVRNEARQYASVVGDSAGIPLFFVWNAWAAWKVIRAAEVYIMAPGLIQQLSNEVNSLHEDINFRQNIFDAMQYVVTVKRSFHHNHYLLVKRLVEVFDLKDFKDMETDRMAFLEKIKASPPEIKSAYSKLIVMGMIIDGGVSRREKKALAYLWTEGIININPDQAREWCQDFRKGRGLDDLIHGN